MKKDIVDIIFKEKYPAYKENTNLQYEIETTEENHILITLPKYPICLLTLWGDYIGLKQQHLEDSHEGKKIDFGLFVSVHVCVCGW